MARKSRRTKQKEEVEKQIDKIKDFFTADELDEKTSEIGIATIYRHLAEKVKKGELHKYQCKGKTIYSKHNTTHSHFICEKCGDVKHMNIKNLDFLSKEIEGKICHIQIDISGVCEKCATSKSQ